MTDTSEQHSEDAVRANFEEVRSRLDYLFSDDDQLQSTEYEWELWQAAYKFGLAARNEWQPIDEDSARYRYLRDQAHPDSNEGFGLFVASYEQNDWGRSYAKHHTGEKLDAEIDKAIKVGQPPEET